MSKILEITEKMKNHETDNMSTKALLKAYANRIEDAYNEENKKSYQCVEDEDNDDYDYLRTGRVKKGYPIHNFDDED